MGDRANPGGSRSRGGRRAAALAAAMLAACALVPAVALAQAAQQNPAPSSGGAPKSLLPDELEAPPAPPPGGVEAPVSILPEATGPAPGFDPVPPVETMELEPPPAPEPSDPLAELAGPTMVPELAGLLTPASGGYRTDLFVASDGRFLATLLARIDAPLASRWAQVMLSRALLTRAQAPGPLAAADWVAARGAALAAMGSGADAHRLVSSVAIDRYTARLYAVAAQAALAAADPMALCPLSPTARLLTETPTWALADAMCLAILGDEVGASALFDRLRRQNAMAAFDIGLAERIASATGSGRRGANPEWAEAEGGLTAWRLGLTSAAGLALPDDLLQRATLAQKAWFVRLPGESIARRAAFAPAAASTGAISTEELGRILAAEAAGLDPAQAGNSPGGQLRTARMGADVSDRLKALQALWRRASPGTAEQYGWQLATAPAAARIPVSSGLAAEAPLIVASLVAAGITGQAARWWPATEAAEDDVRARVWAQLVAVAPGVPVEKGLFRAWSGTVPAHRAQLLAAGLQGLGRGDLEAEVPLVENGWTRALDRAATAGRAGEVMVLAATGLQGNWADVPPDYLRRIAAALGRVGHAAEARLIVAEAANRG